MTDYASQGRTRPVNIVDLLHCKDHQSVYTCLSRASTLKGTVILRMPDISKITKGLKSGYLRGEFRELALLDEITRLRYEGKLLPGVVGNTRATLLRSFKAVYGDDYCPSDLHQSLRWSAEDPLILPEDYSQEDAFRGWKRLGDNKKTSSDNKSASAVSSTIQGIKRRRDSDSSQEKPPVKRKDAPDKPQKRRRLATNTHSGTIWRQETWSCAYDALVTILSNAYFGDVALWNRNILPMNPEFDGAV